MSIFEVIKNDKENKSIVWRYPKRNFNTGSKLVVNESEEALFFSCGEALDLFGPGKYTLNTNNIPLLKRLINIPTGGKTPFTCEIYFIDKTIKQMKWGTSSKLEFLEPIYKFPIKIGACGEMRFQIEDSRKFIIKLVGIKKNFNASDIDEFFASQILVKVKAYLTSIIKKDKISIFEIDERLEEISYELKERLTSDFQEFGIKINNFFLSNIAKPEDDREYLKFKELYFKKGVLIESAKIDKELSDLEAEKEASRVGIAAKGMAAKRETEGYTYSEEKGFEVGKEVARNEAVGQFTNIGVGLGIMSGTSKELGSEISKQVSGAFTKLENKFCTYCGNNLPSDAVFCSKCGKKVN